MIANTARQSACFWRRCFGTKFERAMKCENFSIREVIEREFHAAAMLYGGEPDLLEFLLGHGFVCEGRRRSIHGFLPWLSGYAALSSLEICANEGFR
jgi:hypothetical protein